MRVVSMKITFLMTLSYGGGQGKKRQSVAELLHILALYFYREPTQKLGTDSLGQRRHCI